MPFTRPTLTELRNQAASDIATGVPGADALLRFSNLMVLGFVLASTANGHYGYLDWIAKQAVPFTATGEFLEGWAGLKGVTRLAAAAASGSVTLTGTVGSVISSGSLFVRGDGVEFKSTSSQTISGGGTAVIPVVAVVPAAASNTDAGSILTLGVSIGGVQSNGTVTTAIKGGVDVETDDNLRSRMLEQYAAPPQGGDQTDYIEWARTVPGVTRAWSTPLGMGAGTVVVYTMFDVAESGHNGFPQGADGAATNETRAAPATGDQLAVANYIFNVRPATALVYSVAPVANTVNFTINGIAGASSDTKAAIVAAIKGVFLRQGGPAGAYDGARVQQGTVLLSYIEAAVAAISGTTGFIITSPAGNITGTTGQIPILGTITYT